VNSYEQISNVERRITEWASGLFLKERMLFQEMVNDILDPIRRGTEAPLGDNKSPVIILMARLINDFEAAMRLILMGLGEQAYQPMRDSVETSLLLLLFQHDEQLAIRWMIDLKQYTAGNVIAQLKKHNVDYPLGEMYSTLSALSHPNLVASMHVVEETQVGEDQLLRTYHFGGYRNAGFMELQLKSLLLLMMMAIVSALPVIFAAHDPEFLDWWEKAQNWPKRLRDELGLDVELTSTEPVDKEITRKIELRLKVDLFKREAVQEASRVPEGDGPDIGHGGVDGSGSGRS